MIRGSVCWNADVTIKNLQASGIHVILIASPEFPHQASIELGQGSHILVVLCIFLARKVRLLRPSGLSVCGQRVTDLQDTVIVSMLCAVTGRRGLLAVVLTQDMTSAIME